MQGVKLSIFEISEFVAFDEEGYYCEGSQRSLRKTGVRYR